MNKREDYLSWNDYFMGLALLSAKRSKDPSTQVGACIVNKSNKIVSVGYNGMPFGCSDDEFPWQREGDELETKYPYVVHAELNAILNSKTNLTGCTMFVTLFPCNECAKAIVQAGITKVYYLDNKYSEANFTKAAVRLLEGAGVEVEKFNPSVSEITLKF